MKGFPSSNGYWGFFGNYSRMLFPTEQEYIEYMKEKEEEDGRKDNNSSGQSRND